MNAKTKKLALIGAAAVVLCAGIFMALQAFNENLVCSRRSALRRHLHGTAGL